MSVVRIEKSGITGWGGRPDLYIRDVKMSPLLYAMSDIPASRAWKEVSRNAVKTFAGCGINIVCVDVNLKDGWKEDGTLDATFLFREIEAVLESNPQAKIIARLHLNPPYFWMRKYPEELITFYGAPSTDSGDYGDRLIAKDRTLEMKVSFASLKWQKDCGDVLREFCKCAKTNPMGEALVGIQVAYGTCGEWHYFGKYADENAFEADYSVPMRRFFRTYLREKYKTKENFQKYYGGNVDFESVELPTPKQKSLYWQTDLLDPEKHSLIIDAQKCYSLSAAKAITYFCKIIKETCGKEMLAGSFYGYFFLIGAAPAAHYEPNVVFEEDSVDFLAGPCGYIENKKSGKMNLLRYLPESNRLNGKLFLCEMDQGYRSYSCGEIYKCENEQEYEAILKRNILENLIHGHGAWYYDHRLPTDSIYEKTSYWTSKESLATIKRLQEFADSVLLNRPFVKTTDVLVVQDTERAYYTAKQYDHFALIDALGKSGVGFDNVYLSDLQKCDLSRYKCVLFVNCQIFSKDLLEYVKTKVCGQGRTVLFMGQLKYIIDDCSISQSALEIFGAEEVGLAHKEKKEEKEIYYSEEIFYDNQFYREFFRRAGVHIYTEGNEVCIADNNMVMIHTKDIPFSTLHLHSGDLRVKNGDCSTIVYDTQTGKRIL